MTDHVFNADYFRSRFCAYADIDVYPTSVLAGYWDTSTRYISDQDQEFFAGTVREEALYLLTAHQVFIYDKINLGRQPGLVESVRNDKQDVKFKVFPAKDQFEHWLSTSPYGQQLLFLLSQETRGGLYVGGSFETQAFRRVNGDFGSL